MDTYKKLLEYEEMLKDGIISEAEYENLKGILYSQKMSELSIRDKTAFEELLKKGAFEEATLMLNNKTAASYREAIALLETLGDWGDAKDVVEQCRSELSALEEQEEKEKAEKAEKAKEELYSSAIQLLSKNTLDTHKKAIKDLESLGDWKDAPEIIEKSKFELPELEKQQIETQKKIEERKKKKKTIIIAAVIGIFVIAGVVSLISMKLNSINAQIAGDTSVEYIKNLMVLYPKDWEAQKITDTLTITNNTNKGWRAEEKITYLREDKEDVDIKERYASLVTNALSSGDINIEGIKGEYIVTNKRITNKGQEVTSYLAIFKIQDSVFDYNYSTYTKEYDDSQPEALLKLINAAKYQKPTIDDYIISYNKSSLVEGAKTSELKETMTLTRHYSNGYEVVVDQTEWSIKEPEVLKAPKTSLYVNVDGDTFEFVFDEIIEAKKSDDAKEESD